MDTSNRGAPLMINSEKIQISTINMFFWIPITNKKKVDKWVLLCLKCRVDRCNNRCVKFELNYIILLYNICTQIKILDEL